jgi:PAS domain S-box-containing protein
MRTMCLNLITVNRIGRFLLLCCTFLWANTAWAIQYNFLTYSVREGLPHSRIYTIFQDKLGYIWLGTDGGAARFDGNDFVVFNASSGISEKAITAITETDEGVFLATDQGVTKYAYGKFITYPIGNGVRAIYQLLPEKNGAVLIATDKGLFRFVKSTFQKITTSTSLDQLSIRSMYLDSIQGDLWVGTERNGLFHLRVSVAGYSISSYTGEAVLSNAGIRGIDKSHDGILWIATQNDGLFSFEKNSLQNVVLPSEIYSVNFTSLKCDATGNVWMGTWGRGVVRYNKNSLLGFDKSNGLKDDVITTLLVDREENLWFGGYTYGLSFYPGDQFVSITVKDGLKDDNVRDIIRDPAGNFWIATLAGLVLYDGLELRTIPDLEDKRIGAIEIDEQGVIYAGLMSGEIACLKNGKLERLIVPPRGLPISEIISMHFAQDGILWIGTASSGLFRLKNNVYEFVNCGNILQRTPIWDMSEDALGNFWLATGKGLFVLQNGAAVQPTVSKGNAYEKMTYGIETDENYIYFSTARDGIGRYNIKKKLYQFFRKDEGLSSNFTKSILRVDSSRFIVTTLTGLDMIRFTTDGQEITHFTSGEEIGTTEFNPACIIRSPDGKIWLASSAGVIIYDPSFNKNKSIVPRVSIEEILLMNDIPDWAKYADSLSISHGFPVNPVFPHDKNKITFRFASMHYGLGKKTYYRYRLKGFDKDWLTLTDGNIVNYSNLAPNHYKFQVQAGTSDGLWGEIMTHEFTISPPFWATWWFFLIVLIVIASIGASLAFAYQRYRLNFIRQQRSLHDNQLHTARLVLILGGFFYMLAGVLCGIFAPELDLKIEQQVILGLTMFIVGVLSYYRVVFKKQTVFIMHMLYGLVLLHVLYLCHLNALSPVTVVMLIISLSAMTVAMETIRVLIIYAAVVLSVAAYLMLMDTGLGYNKWLFFVAILATITISFIGLLAKLNLFNRLVFADTTINNSRSLVIASDNSGHIIFVSRSIKTILGYSEDEVLGEGWWKIRSDKTEDNELMRSKIIQGEDENKSYIVPIKSKNGNVRWIQWVDSSMEGGVRVGVGLDVTDRHEIEQRYRHMIDSATDIIYTANHLGEFTFANEVATKITGYSQDELLGMNFTTLIHDNWKKETTIFYKKQFSRRVTSTYYEFPIIKKGGDLVWIGQTVRIQFDEIRQNFIKGFQAIARDITEKKQYEDELEKLSLVASETMSGVIISDADDRIEWVNDAITRMTGYTMPELSGKRTADLMNGESTDMEVVNKAREKATNGNSFEIELLLYHKEGFEVWFSISNTAIFDENGDILKHIEIYTDISEKKRYEIQLSSYSRRLEILNMVRQGLLRSQSIEDVGQFVLAILANRISYCTRLAMGMLNYNQDKMNMYYVWRNSSDVLEQKEIPVNQIRSIGMLRQNKYVYCENLLMIENPSTSDVENIREGIRSYFIMPLWAQGQLLGSINVGADETHSFTDEEIDLIQEVATAMATTLLQLRYREILDQKNIDIAASINYARRIQDSILPPIDILQKQLGDCFVIYKSKDILSGDFYWAEKHNGKVYVAVADSTGHGVPGALLSMIGHNTLNQAIIERGLTTPAVILDFMNTSIQRALNQYNDVGELSDGMDITLCAIDVDARSMEFAGAINPIYIIRHDGMFQWKGNRFSIGSYSDNKIRPFSNESIQLHAGDMLYMFTDGYPDQFGGINDRKLSHRRFREMLMEVHTFPVATQKVKLEAMLTEWMKDTPQTDDITVLGIRIQ